MKIHPYRDVIDYNQLLRCQKQRKHFSGVGNIQCDLNLGHHEFCKWPDHESWVPQIENVVRVSYPYEHNSSFYGDFLYIVNVYSCLDGPCIYALDKVIYPTYPLPYEFRFRKEELELIRTDYM